MAHAKNRWIVDGTTKLFGAWCFVPACFVVQLHLRYKRTLQRSHILQCGCIVRCGAFYIARALKIDRHASVFVMMLWRKILQLPRATRVRFCTVAVCDRAIVCQSKMHPPVY